MDVHMNARPTPHSQNSIVTRVSDAPSRRYRRRLPRVIGRRSARREITAAFLRKADMPGWNVCFRVESGRAYVNLTRVSDFGQSRGYGLD